jgi:hypothetical protein
MYVAGEALGDLKDRGDLALVIAQFLDQARGEVTKAPPQLEPAFATLEQLEVHGQASIRYLSQQVNRGAEPLYRVDATFDDIEHLAALRLSITIRSRSHVISVIGHVSLSYLYSIWTDAVLNVRQQ